MRLTIDREALKGAVEKARGVIVGGGTIPILANLLLEADGERLRVRGAEPDMQVTAAAPAQVEQPGATTVAAGRLHDLVRNMPSGGQVSLELTTAPARLAVRCGRSRVQLPVLPPEDYPAFAADDEAQRAELPAKDLLRILDRVAFAMSSEQVRYWLGGARLHRAVNAAGMGMLRAAATDGARLGMSETACPEGWDAALTLPSKAVNELRRLLADEAGRAVIATTGSLFSVEVGETRLVTKLLDGNFPDYTRVIPFPVDTPVSVDVQELTAGLRRCAVVATDKVRAVTLKATPGALTLAARSAEGGEVEDGLSAEYEGPAFEVGFNGRLLAEQAAMIGGETMRMHFHGPQDPVRFEDSADPDSVFVLVGLRS